MGRPPKPEDEKYRTPRHTFACTDDLWLAAMETAERNGETVSDVIRRALQNYVRRHR